MPARGRAGAWGAGAPAAALRTATAAYHRYLADWLSGVFARLIWLTGANRFPVPSNLITIMVDVCASCRFTDIISEDIDESINMSPSIDRVSIRVWAVITIDCAASCACYTSAGAAVSGTWDSSPVHGWWCRSFSWILVILYLYIILHLCCNQNCRRGGRACLSTCCEIVRSVLCSPGSHLPCRQFCGVVRVAASTKQRRLRNNIWWSNGTCVSSLQTDYSLGVF